MRSTPRLKRLISTVTGMLRDREAVLIGDVETVRHQKEKELQLQKDELEFLLSGIRQAVLFSEAMIKGEVTPRLWLVTSRWSLVWPH